MDAEPDVIRQQIDETRESLTDKLETLEGHVKQTVASVTDVVDTVKTKVEDTVQAVTSSVEHTVETVKRTFNIPEQVQKHPYGMTGGALLAGAALGWLAGRTWSAQRPRLRGRMSRPAPRFESTPGGYEVAGGAAPSRPGFLASLLEPVAGEFDKIKATAIGALMGMVRDAVQHAVPPTMTERVEEIMDNITRRAGGEPVRGPVLPEHFFGEGSGRSEQTHL
jgi:hypothetical protein